MKKISLIIYTIVFVLSFTACNNCIDGSGKISTSSSDLSEYNEVEIDVPANVQIRQSDKHSIEIQADENILSYIEYKVSGKKLKIELKKCIKNFKVLDIVITTPNIKEIELNGAGKIYNSGLIKTKELDVVINGAGNSDFNIDVKKLNIEINGAGSVKMKGIAKKQYIEINGAGSYSAFDLESLYANIDISGIGDCKIKVIEELDVEISGSGNVRYKGNVEDKDIDITGIGKVIKE